LSHQADGVTDLTRVRSSLHVINAPLAIHGTIVVRSVFKSPSTNSYLVPSTFGWEAFYRRRSTISAQVDTGILVSRAFTGSGG
ncbi:unnamed protein product, partial [Prunus brigantina]